MAGLVPATRVFQNAKTWIPETSPGMTIQSVTNFRGRLETESAPMTSRPQTSSRLASLLGGAIVLLAGASSAHACACCTNLGQRRVAVEKFDSGKQHDVSLMRFAPAARLFTGEGDLQSVKGIATPALEYEMSVTRDKDRMVFSFRDKEGRSGTLALQQPQTVSVFEVDPRAQDEEGGLGPSLYKEWKLTSRAAGTGVFAPGAGPRQQITLILQGRGNGCTSSVDFTHWTLVVHGPVAEYHLFGKLEAER
jgi:hypothetical protein